MQHDGFANHLVDEDISYWFSLSQIILLEHVDVNDGKEFRH